MYSFSNLIAKYQKGFSKPRIIEISNEKFEEIQGYFNADSSNPFIRKEMDEFILTFKKTETGWKVTIISK